MNMNGLQKSALLLMSIGLKEASQTFQYFNDIEIDKLIDSILSINLDKYYNIYKIIQEFHMLLKKNNYFVYNLKNTIGEKKNIILLQNNSLKDSIRKKVSILEKLDVKKIFFLIKNEHLQIISVFLIYFQKSISVKLLSFFSVEKKINILFCMKNFSGLNRKGLVEFYRIIQKILDNNFKNLIIFKNMKFIIKNLYFFKKSKIKNIVKNIKKLDFLLVNKFANISFKWKHLIFLKDSDIKIIIDFIGLKLIYISLYQSDKKIQNKFFIHFSTLDFKYWYKINIKNYIFSDIEINLAQKKLLNIVKYFIVIEKILIN